MPAGGGRAGNRRVTILIESRVAEPVVTVPPKASGVTDSILPSDAAPPPKTEDAQKP